jgi:alpha-beta hydrolase superfamily lysophospholipase
VQPASGPAPETVKVGDLPLHCEFYPAAASAPLVLYLPGIATYSALYREFLTALAGHGFNVVGMDLRGHGYSGGPRGHYMVEEVVEDARAVLAHFAARVSGPQQVIGYSIGAPLALAVAEAEPRVSAVLCHSLLLGHLAPDWLHLLGWQGLRWTNLFLPGWKVNLRTLLDLDRLLRQTAYAARLGGDERLVWDYPVRTLASVFAHRHRVATDLQHFRAGVVVGEHDEVVTPGYTRRLLERLAHPFDCIEMAGACHMAPFHAGRALARLSAGWLHVAPGREAAVPASA